jgi:ammonium transporter, Amt family
VLGKRKGWPTEGHPPHSMPLVMIGTGILWFGWFGFNAGSALGANALASQALINTHLAAAAAMCTWLLVEKLKTGHATTLGGASGAVAGLVAITPCAGFVNSMSALAIGAIAGAVCYLALKVKFWAKLDDSLDVLAVHLVGGLVGSLLLGLFADPDVNPVGEGLFFGGGLGLLGDQVIASASVLAFSLVASLGIAKLVDATIGLRVEPEAETMGLDRTLHAETAYITSEA